MRSRQVSLRPNVLLITIDTLRADHLGCYGDAGAATPVLDALAARGVRFATAVAHVPLTTPSHASILTGLTPLRHGVRDNGDFALPEAIPTVAEAFRAAGYQTGAFVSGFPLDRRFGLARGFETYDDHFPHGDDRRRAAYVERPADQTTAVALRWVQARSGPWFLWVHYFDPHAPYEPPAELAARFPGRPYDGEIAFVDAQLGALLQRLDARRPGYPTLVLATADHGESLGEHGEETHGVFIYDATLRVPLLVAGPGVPAGRVASTVARGIDVAPTLLDLAGVPTRARMEGRSLRAALGGDMPDAPAYAESLYARLRLGWAPLHAWRTARYKLIDAPRPELYALDGDPSETENQSAERPAVAAALRGALQTALAAPPPNAATTAGADAAERLRALGYLGGGAAPPSTQRDPKDGITILGRLEHGIAEARSSPAAAARALAGVLAEDPDITLARRYRALALSAAGDTAGAIAEVEVLDRQGLATFDDLLLLADSLRATGRPEKAIAILDRGEAMQPRSPEALLARARTLVALGREGDARAQLERVLALVPDHSEALRGLADLALTHGDDAVASAHYGRILASDPGDVGALVKLGVLDVRAGRVDEGVASFRAAVERDPINAEALLDLGGALAKSGRAPEAIPYLERAIAAGTRTPVALNSLGFARLETGDARGGLEALQASLALDPRQERVAAVVARVRRGERP
jgi:arylsulfatase A-like enzyme/Tfp pilus assembly protein PilF